MFTITSLNNKSLCVYTAMLYIKQRGGCVSINYMDSDFNGTACVTHIVYTSCKLYTHNDLLFKLACYIIIIMMTVQPQMWLASILEGYLITHADWIHVKLSVICMVLNYIHDNFQES